MQTELSSFKFNPINDSGRRAGLRKLEGTVQKDGLLLDGVMLAYENMLSSSIFDKRISIRLIGDFKLSPKIQAHIYNHQDIQLRLDKAEQTLALRKLIDQRTSLQFAKSYKKGLEENGQLDKFKVSQCQHCKSTINLSFLKETPLIYCDYCESIQDRQGSLVSNGDLYSICPNTGLYDRVQIYTEFYFYFFVLFYGYRSEQVRLGDYAAGSKIFPKTLLYNFLFILGIPSAVYMKYKSVKGRDSLLKNLPKGNALAHKGKVLDYLNWLQQEDPNLSKHPGLLFNKAKAAQQTKNEVLFQESLSECLDQCANYSIALDFKKA